MADSDDLVQNTAGLNKVNESLILSAQSTEKLREMLDSLNRQKLEVGEEQHRLISTAKVSPPTNPVEQKDIAASQRELAQRLVSTNRGIEEVERELKARQRQAAQPQQPSQPVPKPTPSAVPFTAPVAQRLPEGTELGKTYYHHPKEGPRIAMTDDDLKEIARQHEEHLRRTTTGGGDSGLPQSNPPLSPPPISPTTGGGDSGPPPSQPPHPANPQPPDDDESRRRSRYAGIAQAEMAMLKRADERKREIEEKAIDRQQKLNNELMMTQYALSMFAANLVGGRPGAAIYAAAGGMGGGIGAAITVVAALAERILQSENDYAANTRRGAAVLSPSGLSTEQATIQLRELRQAQREGALEAQDSRIRLERRREQATLMGMRRYEDPEEFWRHTDEGATREAFTRGNRAYWHALLHGRGVQEAEKAQADIRSNFFEQWIREHGGQPGAIPRNYEAPGGVQASVGTSLDYQTQLQLNQFQRQDVNNEILQEQLISLNQVGALLSEIRNNTNGLENLRVNYTP